MHFIIIPFFVLQNYRGRPGAAFYFIGIQGDELLYLDPHQYRLKAISKKDPKAWTQAVLLFSFDCRLLFFVSFKIADPPP